MKQHLHVLNVRFLGVKRTLRQLTSMSVIDGKEI